MMKNSMMTKLLLCSLIVVLSSCKREEISGLRTIGLNGDEMKSAVSFQEFLSDPEYLPLETNDLSLFGYGAFWLTDAHIYVQDQAENRLLVFDRRDGRFVKKIGEYGRGPEEYFYLTDEWYNLPQGKVFAQDAGRNLVQYDTEGRMERKIALPFSVNPGNGEFSLPTSCSWLNDSVMCAFYLNITGAERKRLVCFSPDGRALKVYPNHHVIEDNLNWMGVARDGIFYNYEGQTYFKEQRCDTVFRVGLDSLQPCWAVNYGEFTEPYENRYKPGVLTCDLYQRGVGETERYLYFLFHYQENELLAVYDKQEEKQCIYKIDGYQGKKELMYQSVALIPGYLLTQLPAVDIASYFEDIPGEQDWQKVKESDNTVLVFWKLP